MCLPRAAHVRGRTQRWARAGPALRWHPALLLVVPQLCTPLLPVCSCQRVAQGVHTLVQANSRESDVVRAAVRRQRTHLMHTQCCHHARPQSTHSSSSSSNMLLQRALPLPAQHASSSGRTASSSSSSGAASAGLMHGRAAGAGRACRRHSVLALAATGKASYSASSVKPPARGKHFLHIDDFSTAEVQQMLDLGLMAKQKLAAKDQSFKPFAGHSMCMIFTKASARTRISFETVGWGAAHARPCAHTCACWRALPALPCTAQCPALPQLCAAVRAARPRAHWGPRVRACKEARGRTPSSSAPPRPRPRPPHTLHAPHRTALDRTALGCTPGLQAHGRGGDRAGLHQHRQARAHQGHCARRVALQRRHHGTPRRPRGPAGAGGPLALARHQRPHRLQPPVPDHGGRDDHPGEEGAD